VEASWRVVDDVLTDHEPAIVYREHTWGPEEQALLIGGMDVWHDPVPADCPPEVDAAKRSQARSAPA
jgi:hypothetical protein